MSKVAATNHIINSDCLEKVKEIEEVRFSQKVMCLFPRKDEGMLFKEMDT